MSITPVSPTAVAVDTFADLKTLLENTGNAYTNITTVYLNGDITLLSGGINISRTRSNITLDGLNPFDQTTIHTITDVNSSGSGDPIGVRTTGNAIVITYQNINWIGKNYYGICITAGSTSYQNVTIILKKIIYQGPQIIYHAIGITRFIDCTINIEQGYSPAQEIGEVCQIEFDGFCVLNHFNSAVGYSMFAFRGDDPYVTIFNNANVTFNTANTVFDSDAGDINLIINQDASLTINTTRGVFYSTADRASSILVDSNAKFKVIQSAANTSTATINCSGSFIVNQNAFVYINGNYSSSAPLIYFYTTSASLTLNNPLDFALYTLNSRCFAFYTTTSINITVQQANYWTSSNPSLDPGGFTDLPTYSWRKEDESFLVTLTGTTTNTTTTLTSNLTADELIDKPLSNLRLYNVPVISFGNIPLTVDPIVEGYNLITGITAFNANVKATINSIDYPTTADINGAFSIQTPIIQEDSSVTIAINIPFLIIRKILQSVEPGSINFLFVPTTLPFNLNVISTNPTILYTRQDPNWTLTIEDTRIISNTWYLYATIDDPLTSQTNSNHTLPNALVYVDPDRNLTEINPNITLVYIGEGNLGVIPKITSVSWPSIEGVLLQSISTPFFNGEEYKTSITWILSETPLLDNN